MRRLHQSGFTLVELAVTMIIIGLLLGGAISTMAAQHNLKVTAETNRLLEEAQEALIGFAIAAGRLPCPSQNDLSDKGRESPDNGSGACTVHDGFVPARALGIGPTDTDGFLLDPWGNRIRYAITDAETNAFTTAGKIRSTMTIEEPKYLTVDDSEVAVFVIYSTGKDATVQATTNNGKSFATSENHDDVLLWLSSYSLYSRLSAARAL